MLFEEGGETKGYALFRREPEYFYLRHLFVRREHHRKGIARGALAWLRRNVWALAPRVRIDVLVGNESAIAFWGSVGFREYCITMEWEWNAGFKS